MGNGFFVSELVREKLNSGYCPGAGIVSDVGYSRKLPHPFIVVPGNTTFVGFIAFSRGCLGPLWCTQNSDHISALRFPDCNSAVCRRMPMTIRLAVCRNLAHYITDNQ